MTLFPIEETMYRLLPAVDPSTAGFSLPLDLGQQIHSIIARASFRRKRISGTDDERARVWKPDGLWSFHQTERSRSVPYIVSAITENDTLQNNTRLTDKELLNLQISDVLSDEKVIDEIDTVDSHMTKEEASKIEQSILKLEEDEFLIDEETFAYIDQINSDIDVQQLIEEEILSEQNNVEALIAPVVVRAAISATVALLRKARVNILKVSYHLGVRMIERDINPSEVYNAVTKGKKFYDPKYSSTVYYYDGIAVAKKGDTLTTKYKSKKPNSRYVSILTLYDVVR